MLNQELYPGIFLLGAHPPSGVYTRVSAYSNWIDLVTTSSVLPISFLLSFLTPGIIHLF